jgi:hypothetical protein
MLLLLRQPARQVIAIGKLQNEPFRETGPMHRTITGCTRLCREIDLL